MRKRFDKTRRNLMGKWNQNHETAAMTNKIIDIRNNDCNAGEKKKKHVTDCEKNEYLGRATKLMQLAHQQKRK